MKRYIALIVIGIIAYIAFPHTDLIAIDHAQTILYAMGTLAAVTIIVYGLCKAWERRLNA